MRGVTNAEAKAFFTSAWGPPSGGPSRSPAEAGRHTLHSSENRQRLSTVKAALARIWNWFDERLQIGGTIAAVADHPVPTRSASWWYVFGSGALTLFAL